MHATNGVRASFVPDPLENFHGLLLLRPPYVWTLCLVCIKLQTICLSYTIQTFGEFKNRHIHRSGPRFLEHLPPPPVYFPRDLHHQACEGPREADVHNLETIGPQLYRTFTGGRQFLCKIATVYSTIVTKNTTIASILLGPMHRRRNHNRDYRRSSLVDSSTKR